MGVTVNKSVTYTLPWPISLNQYRLPIVMRGSNGKQTARLTTSPAGRKYKSEAQSALVEQGIVIITGHVKITEWFYCKTNARYDIDNMKKATRDALVETGVITDDYLVVHDEGFKMPKDPENPRVEITIEQTKENQE